MPEPYPIPGGGVGPGGGAAAAFDDWPTLDTWLSAQPVDTRAILYGSSGKVAGVFRSDGAGNSLLEGTFDFQAGGDFGLSIGSTGSDDIENQGSGSDPTIDANGLNFGQADGQVVLNFLKIDGDEPSAVGRVAITAPTPTAGQIAGVGYGVYAGCAHVVAGPNWHRGALENGVQIAGVGAANQIPDPSGGILGIGGFSVRNTVSTNGSTLTGYAFASTHTGGLIQAGFSSRTAQTWGSPLALSVYAESAGQGDFGLALERLQAIGGFST